MNEGIRPYLNAQKVPQLLVSTGASVFGDAKAYPWTGGWQPVYDYESRIYGQAIAHNSPNAKIAVLYQNDDFGKENLEGLKKGLGGKASNIVATEAHEVTAPDVRAQVARLRASGATILVIFTTPRFMIQTYAIANALRWSPAVIYTTQVSATDAFLTLARTSGGGDLVDRTYTVQYAEGPGEPLLGQRLGDEALQVRSWRSTRRRRRVTDALNYYGVATAEAFVELLYSAGKNPTRASLMKAYRNWNQANQFLLPGNRQKTGGDRPAADPVLPDHQVHQRGVHARVEAEVRHGEVDVGRPTRSVGSAVRAARAALTLPAAGTRPSTAPSSSSASSGGRGRRARR